MRCDKLDTCAQRSATPLDMEVTTNTSQNQTSSIHDFVRIPQAIILLIRLNGLLVILLNVFVLVFILFNRKIFRELMLWTQMISLCLNDAFAGVSIVVASYIDNQPFFNNRIACRLVLVIALTSQLTSLCNIFAICAHRLWVLRRVRRTGLRLTSYKPFCIQISMIICIGLAFTLTAVFGWSIKAENDGIAGCEFTAAYGRNKSKATLFIACSVFIPLLLTNVLYIAAFIFLKQSFNSIAPAPNTCTISSSNMAPGGQSDSSQTQPSVFSEKRRLNRERNALLIIAIVLVAMDIFTLPTIVMQIDTVVFAQNSQIPRSTKLSIASTITFNSFINPFIYIVRLPEFRKSLMEHMRRLWSR